VNPSTDPELGAVASEPGTPCPFCSLPFRGANAIYGKFACGTIEHSNGAGEVEHRQAETCAYLVQMEWRTVESVAAFLERPDIDAPELAAALRAGEWKSSTESPTEKGAP